MVMSLGNNISRVGNVMIDQILESISRGKVIRKQYIKEIDIQRRDS